MVACLRDSATLQQCFPEDDESNQIENIASCAEQILTDQENELFAEAAAAEMSGRKSISMRTFRNVTRTCLDPYVDCVNSTIQDRMGTLDPCLKRSLRRMARCARQNRATCQNTCQATENQAEEGDLTEQFSTVDRMALDTCAGIEAQVMGPGCHLFRGCCEPCVSHLSEVLDCLVNDVLTGLSPEEEECAFACRNGERLLGALGREQRQGYYLPTQFRRVEEDDPQDDIIANECLQYAPGLTGLDDQELVDRVRYFLPCVYDEYEAVIQQPDESQASSSWRAKGINDPIVWVLTLVTFILAKAT